MSVVRSLEKTNLVAFGVDEPNSSEPVKGLKEGVFQVRGEECVSGEEEDGSERAEGKG